MKEEEHHHMGHRARGHVLYGTVFLLVGLWHLFNHIKLHILNPKTYISLTWFPTSRFRHLELFIMMAASILAIFTELLFGLLHRHPLDPDGTHILRDLEHSIIALGIFTYAFLAILLDKFAPGQPAAQYGLTTMIGSMAFALELLVFHVHSTDHKGLEGHYHWLLQIVVFVLLATTLLGINYPKSFLISFVRSLSLFFQGVWFVTTGIMLWTPGLIPKGCFLNWEMGYFVVRCHGEGALERAKSLVNILFSYCVVGLNVLAVTIYLIMFKMYSRSAKVDQCQSLNYEFREDEEEK